MKCPNCHDREHVDVVHGDGFTHNDTRECLTCGAIWYYSQAEEKIKVIKPGDKRLAKPR